MGDGRGSEELQRGTQQLLEAIVMFISLAVVIVSHTHTHTKIHQVTCEVYCMPIIPQSIKM